ncbi:unnamed protein product [Clonostachys rosea]|uniref:Amino acid permease/ SLC12A domain-containing protein n=1 Tax=Bionectria ochroleuca TaxID=29856 RepID=A0ABY6V084_BIOOC|nr:unnamed protein product [Clonostachys rosea]
MSASLDEKKVALPAPDEDVAQSESSHHQEGLHRKIGSRQIQLFAIGGSIGTALFVSIGSALYSAGPAGLLLAFTIYCCLLALVNNAMAEMGVYMPISGGFVRLAKHWVGEGFGFMAGVNFYLYEALTIPFEITALNIVLSYWRDDIPIGAVCACAIVAYFVINVSAVKYYGEAEFWLSSGKVLLFLILFCFTFITMAGGNPKKDAFGFRNWQNPGPFSAKGDQTSLSQFQGFLSALFYASLIIVGPEYISMVSGEARRPTRDIKKAYKTIYYRFAFFFIGGALCVGILIPSNHPTLAALAAGTGEGSGTAAASPYVIAMKELNVSVLPHLVNALLFTSIFSAGNTYVYCATRNLYSLSLEGQVPRFFSYCTKNGVPIYCLLVTMLFPCLSLLGLSNSSAVVIDWFVNLLTSGAYVNFAVMCFTYIRFYKACKVQGLDRNSLPYRGWFQPYSTWFVLVALIVIALCSGYTMFLPGNFSIDFFMTNYVMLIIAAVSYLGWTLIKRAKFVIRATDVDLVWLRPEVLEYEETLPHDDGLAIFREVRRFLSCGKWRKDTAEA